MATTLRSLRQLIYSDIKRQLELEGKQTSNPCLREFLKRILHHRFLPIFFYRVSRFAFLSGFPLLPQILTYLNIILFGIEISPKCAIGSGLFLPHTYGTVIGAYEIGSEATIFQGVTLGAKKLDMQFEAVKRPCIGNHVTLGAGAKIIGGIVIGDFVTVGANAVVLSNVSAYSTVAGVPARVIHTE